MRGYQFKSEGKGETRKNNVAYRNFDEEDQRFAGPVLPSPDETAQDLEGKDFAGTAFESYGQSK